jgi:hypothetical protein
MCGTSFGPGPGYRDQTGSRNGKRKLVVSFSKLCYKSHNLSTKLIKIRDWAFFFRMKSKSGLGPKEVGPTYS